MRTLANDAWGNLLALFADVRKRLYVRNPITLPSLGDRIKRRRLELGLSMRALAQAAKLKSVAFVADVERGFRNPSSEVLRDLALALELPLDELRGLDRRAPVQEIRTMTERNPAWAAAFRRVVDAAEAGDVTPDELVHLLEKQLAEKPKEGMLNFR
jgi:transcriptional regulator with XRE-family HTH domain